MAEVLAARSGLGSSADSLRRHGIPGVVELRESAFTCMYDLRLDPADIELLSTAQKALSVELPVKANQARSANGSTAIWFGPDQWLLIIDADAAAALRHVLPRRDASFVEVSDLRSIFELSGPRAPDVIRKGCAIDVHPRAFAPGDSALTNFARIRVALRQLDAVPTYQLFVDRSYAEYLWTWLEDAMVEFGEGGREKGEKASRRE